MVIFNESLHMHSPHAYWTVQRAGIARRYGSSVADGWDLGAMARSRTEHGVRGMDRERRRICTTLPWAENKQAWATAIYASSVHCIN